MARVLTSDPDEFRAGLEGIYGDMWCLDSTNADVWQLQRCRIGSISLQRGVVPGGNLVVGEPRSDLRLFYFLESKQAGSRFNGQAIEGHTSICFQPGQEFFLSHDHPHRWISLAIDASDLSPTESCVIDGPPTRAATRAPSYGALGPDPVSEQLIEAVVEILSSAAMAPSFAGSRAAGSAERMLLARLGQVSGLSGVHDPAQRAVRAGRPPLSRSGILQRCREVLSAKEQEPVTVAELARQCGISRRTLQQVFTSHFGFGPSRFLQLRQLHRVHRQLRECDPRHTNVADVLLDHGVWNFNHFGIRYRHLFGCTPRQSLNAYGPF